ncbi:MAG: InlB B-repeat-containing protein, partial [Clostridiales Family XIII bacterium]|nr:InlB B-repeat-containing protein [Clostridiales Family XIII bacterium]
MVYTLDYDLNDSTGPSSASRNGGAAAGPVAYGARLDSAAHYAANTSGATVPTRTGYDFGGWHLESA